MLRAYKYRMYPTDSQKELLDKHLNACRFIYNLALETKNRAYISCRKNITCFELMRQTTELKLDCPWLKEVDSQALQQSIIDLDKAFTQFFKSTKGFPNFKNKYGKQSYRSPHEDRIRIENEKVRLPKFKAGIKIIQDRKYKGELRNATISKTTTGKYYISCLVETGVEIPVKKPIQESTAIGIDLGIKTYIATSEGKEYQNPKYLKNSIDRLKILQKRASKKVKGSSNRKKANLKVALLHEKITNQRKDFLHKLSTEITNQYDTICCENLNIEEMVKNHKLAGAVQDAGWGEFVRQLKYKSEWYGKNLLQIPTFQASTKVCSTCGTMKQGLTLADREWDCDNCQTHHDRDINAAKVIKQYCITHSGQVLPGESVELPTMVGTMKQKDTKLLIH